MKCCDRLKLFPTAAPFVSETLIVNVTVGFSKAVREPVVFHSAEASLKRINKRLVGCFTHRNISELIDDKHAATRRCFLSQSALVHMTVHKIYTLQSFPPLLYERENCAAEIVGKKFFFSFLMTLQS